MKITAIAKLYWRMIKDGQRTYDSIVGNDKKREVKELAGQDVADGVITPEEYETYIGELYQAEEAQTEAKTNE